MTQDELKTKTKAELQAILDERGIEYQKRATNDELINLILEEKEAEEVEDAQEIEAKTEESADQNEIEGDQEVEDQTLEDEETATDTDKEAHNNVLYDDYQDLIDDTSFMVVPGQMLKVITKDEEGKTIEGLIEADILLDGQEDYIDELTRKLRKSNDQKSDSDAKSTIAIDPEELNQDHKLMPIDVRLIPNQVIQSRNRAGHTFTNQWSTYYLTEEQLKLITEDHYLEARANQEQ